MNDRLTASTINDAQLDALYAELDRLREGEEPYTDEHLIPTPAQWIWLWNHADPAERLERAKRALDESARVRHLDFLRIGGGEPAEPGAPLCTAYWDTPGAGRVHCWRGAEHEGANIHVGETVGGARYQWWDGAAGSVPHSAMPRAVVEGVAQEAVRQMDADPTQPHTGLVIQPYRDHGVEKWVFRCWGSDTCDGLISLDHTSQQWAEQARDRHLAEEHCECGGTLPHPDCPVHSPTAEPTTEQPMPIDTPDCTATIDGPHVPGDSPVACTRKAHTRGNHKGPKTEEYGELLWNDHHAGAVPHGATTEEG
jgi:hypothetical protein